MSSIRQFSEESSKRIARVVRNAEGGDGNRRSRRRYPDGGGSGNWYRVYGSSEVIADARWEYVLRLQRDNSTTSWDGLEDANTVDLSGRNTYESDRLDSAGYINANVEGIEPITDDTIVWGTPRRVNGESKIIFSVMNEPKCVEA